MLTVVVLLSGPHRYGMLETALDSIPVESSSVSTVLIRHQNGPWNWGGELRERWAAHPKCRIVEFPDRVDFAQSFNRTLDLVETPWALMLPDDDYLLRASAASAFEAVTEDPANERYGFAAFGWYYLKDGRYLASHVKQRDLRAMVHYAPKFCTTMVNMRLVRQVGGFDGTVGGFCDSVLFGHLAFEYDALLSKTPIGIYRLHEGQESVQAQAVYAPFADALRAQIGRYARTPREREAFERRLSEFEQPRTNTALELIQQLSFLIRSQAQPVNARSAIGLHRWSTG
jgi:hypothetical protein